MSPACVACCAVVLTPVETFPATEEAPLAAPPAVDDAWPDAACAWLCRPVFALFAAPPVVCAVCLATAPPATMPFALVDLNSLRMSVTTSGASSRVISAFLISLRSCFADACSCFVAAACCCLTAAWPAFAPFAIAPLVALTTELSPPCASDCWEASDFEADAWTCPSAEVAGAHALR